MDGLLAFLLFTGWTHNKHILQILEVVASAAVCSHEKLVIVR